MSMKLYQMIWSVAFYLLFLSFSTFIEQQGSSKRHSYCCHCCRVKDVYVLTLLLRKCKSLLYVSLMFVCALYARIGHNYQFKWMLTMPHKYI
jgi:hypothetical protein